MCLCHHAAVVSYRSAPNEPYIALWMTPCMHQLQVLSPGDNAPPEPAGAHALLHAHAYVHRACMRGRIHECTRLCMLLFVCCRCNAVFHALCTCQTCESTFVCVSQVRMLLDCPGIRVNQTDDDGDTALIRAALAGGCISSDVEA